MERDLIWNAMVREIERMGGSIDAVRPAKGGHRMLYWTTGNGVKIATTVAAYTGHWRQIPEARTRVRRAARR